MTQANTITDELKSILEEVKKLEDLLALLDARNVFEHRRTQALIQLDNTTSLRNEDVHDVEEAEKEEQHDMDEAHDQAYLDNISGINN